MKLIYQLASALAVVDFAGAYLVPPPGTAAPGTTSSCSGWVQMAYALTCDIFESYFGLTAAQFESWNPSVTELGAGCNLIDSLYYCVQIDFVTMSTGFPTTLTTPTGIYIPPTTTTTTSQAGNGVSTPSPIQTGMASNCNKFYDVASGDTCAAIASAAGISLNDFYAWNPAVGNSCSTLDLGDYVCIGVIGSTTSSTTTKITTSSKGNGISTPSPIQTGMASNCNKFYDVASGDTCAAIASAAGISLTNFYAWNPAVGSTCSFLDLGDYVCIGVIGFVTSTTTTKQSTTTTSSKGNGVSTPSPIQTGMASNCDKFHDVVSGDSCAAIVSAAGIPLSSFYAWNPAVGSSCSFLDVGDYVCIHVIGFTSTISSSTTPTKTTSKGNGVTTPTPIQSGMVTNCDKFHDVVSGDGCAAIASAAGITLANFYKWNPGVGSTCSTLFLGYYVCIGTL